MSVLTDGPYAAARDAGERPVPAVPAPVPISFELRGAIATTVEPSRPVFNRLYLAVARPPIPPDGEASAVLPGIEVVFVTFQWGDGAGALCTLPEAEGIVVSADSDSADWTVTRSSAPDVGYYWILQPAKGPPLAPGDTRGFIFDRIVSISARDLPPTLCFASCAYRSPTGTQQFATASFWRSVPLSVSSLRASPQATTPRAPVTISWTTTGARTCTMAPGDDDQLPPAGQVTVSPKHAQTYSLDALASDGRRASRTLRVPMASGWSELTRLPVVCADAPVLLEGDGEVLCLAPESGVLVSSPDGRDWRRQARPLPVRPWGAVGISAPGRLVLAGGVPVETAAAAGSFVLRSGNGRSWTVVTGQAWPEQRQWPGMAVHAGRLWVLGGLIDDTATASVAASADGMTWTAAPAPWTPRVRPGVACLGEAIWLSGGLTTRGPGAGALSDLWRLGFDGVWTQGPVPPWAGERVLTRLAVMAGRLHALTISLGEGPIALWALGEGLSWELLDAAAPVRSRRLLGARIEAIAFGDGLLVVSDAGAWWWGPRAG